MQTSKRSPKTRPYRFGRDCQSTHSFCQLIVLLLLQHDLGVEEIVGNYPHSCTGYVETYWRSLIRNMGETPGNNLKLKVPNG